MKRRPGGGRPIIVHLLQRRLMTIDAKVLAFDPQHARRTSVRARRLHQSGVRVLMNQGIAAHALGDRRTTLDLGRPGTISGRRAAITGAFADMKTVAGDAADAAPAPSRVRRSGVGERERCVFEYY